MKVALLARPSLAIVAIMLHAAAWAKIEFLYHFFSLTATASFRPTLLANTAKSSCISETTIRYWRSSAALLTLWMLAAVAEPCDQSKGLYELPDLCRCPSITIIIARPCENHGSFAFHTSLCPGREFCPIYCTRRTGSKVDLVRILQRQYRLRLILCRLVRITEKCDFWPFSLASRTLEEIILAAFAFGPDSTV